MVAGAHNGRCPSCGQQYPSDAGYCANDGTKLVSTAPTGAGQLSGRTLDGRYEIRDPLSPVREGAIGTMYRGFQLSVSRECAIKIVHPQYAADAAAVERFLHAGRRAAQLVAPAIANVYDVGRSADGMLYVVSELVRGRPLSDHAGHAMPVRRVVGLGIQLADALAAAHRERIAHGDMDLASIMVDESSVGDQLKLLDIGLACSLGPHGFAPEQLDGNQPDARSDLYAVGTILYELLVGAPPFSASSLEAFTGKHRRERPPQLPPHVPAQLASIVQRLLAKAPAERYQAAGDLRASLVDVQSIVGAPTASSPGIALPRTASADYPPAMPRTATPPAGMAMPRTASGNYTPPAGNPASTATPPAGMAMPRTASADYGMIPRTASTPPAGVAMPRTASADYGMIPRTASTPPAGIPMPRTASGDYPQVPRTASGDYPRVQPGDRSAPVAVPVESGSRRWLVIILVALIASGGGIAAILLAG